MSSGNVSADTVSASSSGHVAQFPARSVLDLGGAASDPPRRDPSGSSPTEALEAATSAVSATDPGGRLVALEIDGHSHPVARNPAALHHAEMLALVTSLGLN